MKTVFIDGRDYQNAQQLHEGFQRLLTLPAYYGKNADALHDCLAEMGEVVNLTVFHPGNDEVANALTKCANAMEDLGGEIKGL
ncbi:MAG: barstar family protein [Clostridia bacterium]|nr:barstar family protein [Clostridia bacterium]